MKTWDEMTDPERSIALAERLGWGQRDLPMPYGCTDVWWFVSAREEDPKLICSVADFAPTTDWRSMGLVVEAMAKKNFTLYLNVYPEGGSQASFRKGLVVGQAGVLDRTPIVVAEAAWRALGGKE